MIRVKEISSEDDDLTKPVNDFIKTVEPKGYVVKDVKYLLDDDNDTWALVIFEKQPVSFAPPVGISPAEDKDDELWQ